MDGAHHLRAEDVGQIGRHGGKAAAVHAQDHAKGRYKQHGAASRCAAGHAEVHGGTQHKEHHIGDLAAELVGQAGPEKAPTNVEQAQERRKAGSDGGYCSELRLVELTKLLGHANQRAAKHLLQHGRRHADHANAGTHVHAQHHPDQPELGDAPDLFHMHVLLRDHGIAGLASRSDPTRWHPAGFGHAVAKGTGHHEDEVDQGHDHKGLHHTHAGGAGKVLHQVGRQGRADHGAAAKAHDGHAGGHAAFVRKPFDQGRHR